MADNEVTGSARKAEKAVVKRPGTSSRTLDKESPRPKSLAVADISMEVGSLKKTTNELKQGNAELKLQMEQQEARVSNRIVQHVAQMDGRFDQIMELLTKQGSQRSVIQAQPGVSGIRCFRKRKVEAAEKDSLEEDSGYERLEATEDIKDESDF